MTDRQTDRQTGYPSVDKPWLKYYSEEAINAPLPECSIYEYMLENNKDYPADIAINYLGRKITYKELFENIDKTASAFIKAGVKEKEIVTVALPSIPEALYCVYALSIGKSIIELGESPQCLTTELQRRIIEMKY